MQRIFVQCFVCPCHQFFHKNRRVEWRGGLEHDAYFVAVGVERADMIRIGFVLASVPLILLGVAEQITVELFDMVFAQRYGGITIENGLHSLCITCDFLLVAGFKVFDLHV